MIARGPTLLLCLHHPKHKMLPKAFFRSPNPSMVRHRLSLSIRCDFFLFFREKQQIVFTRSGVAMALLKKAPPATTLPWYLIRFCMIRFSLDASVVRESKSAEQCQCSVKCSFVLLITKGVLSKPQRCVGQFSLGAKHRCAPNHLGERYIWMSSFPKNK